MKIQVMSDLHFEFQRGRVPDAWFDEIQTDADVLVIAGDMIPVVRHRIVMHGIVELLCRRYERVVYVPGNHDFYHSTPSATLSTLSSVEECSPKFTVLGPDVAVGIDGRRIMGCTLWFRDDPRNSAFYRSLSDFEVIEGFLPWVYEENARHISALKTVGEGDIVVTHYLPSSRSVAPRFKGDETNRFFLCDVEPLIRDRKPALWIHGHTHDACDYRIGPTRVLCNPRGYPHERMPFNPRLVVEL